MPETAGTAFCLGKDFNGFPLCLLVTGDNHLGDALAVGNDERFVREVYQYDADLATIVGVDGAGRVEDGDAMLDGKSAARPHLCLVACRQGHEEACGNEVPLHGTNLDGGFDVGAEVKSCGQWRCILWQRMMAAVDDLDFHGEMGLMGFMGLMGLMGIMG